MTYNTEGFFAMLSTMEAGFSGQKWTSFARLCRTWAYPLSCVLLFVGLWLLLTGPIVVNVDLYEDGERDLLKAWAQGNADWTVDNGPYVAGVDGAFLGTGWIDVVRWFQEWDASVLSLYYAHVVFTALCVTWLFAVLWRRVDPWTAVTCIVLLCASSFFIRTVRIVWHPGLVPAIGCAWMALFVLATTSRTQRAKAWWLVGGWLCLECFSHIHFSLLPYGFVLLCVQCVFWWKRGWRASPLAAIVSIAVITKLAFFVIPVVLELLLSDRVFPLTSKGLSLAEHWTYWLTMFGSAWTTAGPHGYEWTALGWVSVLAMVAGLIVAWRAKNPTYERWLVLLCVTGVVMTVCTVAFLECSLSARFTGACGPAVCLVAALTMLRCTSTIRQIRVRWGLIAVVFLAVVDPVRSTALRTEFSREKPTLSVLEFERALEDLENNHAVDWDFFHTQAHGWAALVYTYRYDVLARGFKTPNVERDPAVHVALVHEHMPLPAHVMDGEWFDGGSGRRLSWVRHRPRFDYSAVSLSAGTLRCRERLPYMRWIQPSPALIDLLGIEPAAATEEGASDGVKCAVGRMLGTNVDTLEVRVPNVKGSEPLTVLLTPAALGPEMVVHTVSGEARKVSVYRPPNMIYESRDSWSVGVFQIAVQDGDSLRISIPRKPLNRLDIY